MKQIFILVIFAAISTVLPSCKKEADQQSDPQNQIQLKTLTAELVANYYAGVGGDVSYDGGELITARGVCWSLNPNPTIKDSILVSGSGTGVFHVNIYNLIPERRYYVRAFATNKYGTVYGNPVTFITVVFKATFRTTQITNITQTTATITGRIIDDGASKITERGFCWDTIAGPTLSGPNHVSVGLDTGTFNFTLTGLLPYTNYYVSAYAVNKAGVGYASNSFITLLPSLPTVVTTPPVITNGQFTSGGTITALPGFEITKRGVGYQTNKGDRMEYFTNDGVGLGTYTTTLSRSQLIGSAIYYVRAYADYKYTSVNRTITGTVYASSIEFSTY